MLPFWKICGFVLYVALYMIACEGVSRWPVESLKEASIKCLPLFQCVLIVLSSHSQEPGYQSYSRRITLALFLSLCGDFLVVWKDYKVYGALVFTIVHCCYISAFRLRPLGGGATLASFFVIAASVVGVVLPAVPEAWHLQLVLVAYYSLLCTMAWRACVRFQQARSTTTLCAVVGALAFISADSLMLVDRYVWKEAWTHAPVVTMSAYYLAQLGMALSATDDYTPTLYDCAAT